MPAEHRARRERPNVIPAALPVGRGRHAEGGVGGQELGQRHGVAQFPSLHVLLQQRVLGRVCRLRRQRFWAYRLIALAHEGPRTMEGALDGGHAHAQSRGRLAAVPNSWVAQRRQLPWQLT